MELSRVRFIKENRKKIFLVILLILAGLIFIVLSKTVLSELFTNPTMNAIMVETLDIAGCNLDVPQPVPDSQGRQPDSIQTQKLKA